MNKAEALKTIVHCVELYEKNLANFNFLVLFSSSANNEIEYIELLFLPQNFKHLTGVEPTNEKLKNAKVFYDTCLQKKLKNSDISFKSDGTTKLKLEILPKVFDIRKSLKMIGEYNQTRLYLQSHYLVGNISYCIGFEQKIGNYFVPNTVLQTDIRNITLKPQKKVVAIFRKKQSDSHYSTIIASQKGFDIQTLSNQEELEKKVNFDEMNFDYRT